LQHYLTTGDPEAVKISDFLNTRQFHNTALYDELYRPLRYEDQYAMQLFPPAAEFVTLVVARDKATFTERERRLLNLVRPHIAQAYRNVQDFARLARRLGRQRVDAATSFVELHADRRIARFPCRVRRWLADYFQNLPYAPGKLPQPLDDWVRRTLKCAEAPDFAQTLAPLVKNLADRQLVIRLLAGSDNQQVRLLLEERTGTTANERLAGLGLTPREIEVLLQLEQGKRNNEIATELRIRPRTVRKHLEHIFDKLDVDNRTAAVARLHASTRR
jgi:DNA-binding CsgD family transcriptional regulator